MSLTRHFPSYTVARSNFRRVLDAAHAGLLATVARDDERYVVLDAEVLREELSRLLPSRAVVVAEGGGWSAFVPGVPVHGDGFTFDEAIGDLVEGLREYAVDWNEELHQGANHRQHRALVELVELSTDEQLRDWIVNRLDAGSEQLAPA